MAAQSETSGTAQQCRRLADVLLITKQMLVLAEQGDWEKVTDLELVRRDDLAACFAVTAPTSEIQLIAEALAALLHMNEQLMAKLKTARAEVMAQGQEFARKRSAAHQYQVVEAGR